MISSRSQYCSKRRFLRDVAGVGAEADGGGGAGAYSDQCGGVTSVFVGKDGGEDGGRGGPDDVISPVYISGCAELVRKVQRTRSR
jgi:hypothetical protein